LRSCRHLRRETADDLENSEPALHAVQESLAAKQLQTHIDGRIADVRDRKRIFRLLKEFKPGRRVSRRRAEAGSISGTRLGRRRQNQRVRFGQRRRCRVAAGAAAMVMISTDKAIEPVSVLGATKRFAEMYCQALDTEFARPTDASP
jgi:O-antigen biosynthesis protein WbqV